VLEEERAYIGLMQLIIIHLRPVAYRADILGPLTVACGAERRKTAKYSTLPSVSVYIIVVDVETIGSVGSSSLFCEMLGDAYN